MVKQCRHMLTYVRWLSLELLLLDEVDTPLLNSETQKAELAKRMVTIILVIPSYYYKVLYFKYNVRL